MAMQEIELTVERLGINGEGVGRLDGLTIFVDGALPGEKVKARLTESRKTFARAEVTELLGLSPHRRAPSCPLFGKCGGCQLMHLEYTQQLEMKRQRVQDALERIGKLHIEVLPCIASPQPLGYRNKIQLPVRNGKLGLFARNTHDLIEVEQCAIHCTVGEKVFAEIQEMLKKTFQGDLRYVLIKTAVHTDQVLVVLVTRDATCQPGFAEALMARMPEVKGVVQNINPSEGNAVLSGEFRLLAGQEWIEEKLCGLLFKVSAPSFFQVNPAQAEQLYAKVEEFCELTGQETLLDAYCGVGTLALILAARAKQVIGIECVSSAIRDAQENATRNQINNAQFLCGIAEKLISDIDAVDVAILNPPRKGCDSALLARLVELKPKRIVYVSCDPATLARDLNFLCNHGYALDAVQPFDMFPQTAHVESVAKLTLGFDK